MLGNKNTLSPKCTEEKCFCAKAVDLFLVIQRRIPPRYAICFVQNGVLFSSSQ